MSLWLYDKKPNLQAGSLTADGLSWHKLSFLIQLFLLCFILFSKHPFKCSKNISVDDVHHKGLFILILPSVSYILTLLILRYCQ